jgi:HPt (histidine-containing phosphotransfer) domain-containing protein
MAGAESIDRAALHTLFETTGGDPAFLAELIDSYCDDTPGLLAAVRHAVDDGDAEALRRAAHSLKSNSATFGALALAALGRDLEEQGRTGRLDGAAERVALAEAEYAHVRRALQAARPAG